MSISLKIEGEIQISHGLEVILDQRAQQIQPCQIDTITQRLGEWDSLIRYQKDVGFIIVFDNPFGARTGDKDFPIVFTLGNFGNNIDYIRSIVDHEAAHKFCYGPTINNFGITQSGITEHPYCTLWT